MHAVNDLIQTILQASTHSFGTELQPFFEQTEYVFDLWPLVDSNHVEIYAVVFLEISR